MLAEIRAGHLLNSISEAKSLQPTSPAQHDAVLQNGQEGPVVGFYMDVKFRNG